MRSPSTAENQILDQLLAKIQAIALAGTPAYDGFIASLAPFTT